jgi:hypothetical protein
MTPVRIYGAGMAGLLASEMLRKVRPTVYEAQAELPDNHGALLRFRTDAVARETGQAFRRVRVMKAVKSEDGRLRSSASLSDANKYSYKVTGSVASRSILDLSPCDRYVAPTNFLNAMARDAVLRMKSPLSMEDLAPYRSQREFSIISTIPMPALMKIVGWDASRAGFAYRPIWSLTATIPTPVIDLFQTIYYPDLDTPWYRASFTGNRLIIEYMNDPAEYTGIMEVLADFGLSTFIEGMTITIKRQEFGKLLPMNETARQEFILAMTDEFNLYSVGRFATWRQILLDDVVNDVRVVERMISQRNTYQTRLGGLK